MVVKESPIRPEALSLGKKVACKILYGAQNGRQTCKCISVPKIATKHSSHWRLVVW